MTNEAIAAAGGPEALSDRQRRILEAVKRHIGKHGYPPSLRDIRDECRISSVSVVNYNLARLEEYGYLRPRRRTGAWHHPDLHGRPSGRRRPAADQTGPAAWMHHRRRTAAAAPQREEWTAGGVDQRNRGAVAQ